MLGRTKEADHHRDVRRPPVSRWTALVWITLAELLAMSVWFSASAVTGALTRQWHLSGTAVTWLTSSVQLGFVGGALLSASLGLPDRVRPRSLMAWALWGLPCPPRPFSDFPTVACGPLHCGD